MSFRFVDISIRYKSMIAICLLAALGIASSVVSLFAIRSVEHKLHDVTGIYAPMLRTAGETIHYAAEADKDAVEVLAHYDQAKLEFWTKEFEKNSENFKTKLAKLHKMVEDPAALKDILRAEEEATVFLDAARELIDAHTLEVKDKKQTQREIAEFVKQGSQLVEEL
ncbi:MAG: hypothetical protein AAF479_13060, partial [Pseudomonadota bacterium]